MAQSQAMAQREPGGACRELWCLAWARALQAEHSAGCQNSQSSVQALREHHGRIHPSPQHYQGLGIARLSGGPWPWLEDGGEAQAGSSRPRHSVPDPRDPLDIPILLHAL